MTSLKQLCTDFGFGELKGANNLVSEKQQEDDSDLDEHGQRQHRQMRGRLLWSDRPDTKKASVSALHARRNSHQSRRGQRPAVGEVLGRESAVYFEGCQLDVLIAAGTLQVSVLVMTDADWAGDVKDRRSYSQIAVWVKIRCTMETWYPVYAPSKKQNMTCLSSGE